MGVLVETWREGRVRRRATAVMIGLALGLAWALDADAKATRIETDDLTTIEPIAREMADAYGPGQVLVVFDIDNTLLTMGQDLGSDAWFNWQAGLVGRDPLPAQAAAADMAGLLEAAYALFALSDMVPTQTPVPTMLDRLEGNGFPVMALTARGPEARDVTLRALRDDGIEFSSAPGCVAPLCGDGVHIPRGRIQAAARQRLDVFERQRLGIDGPRRDASYGRGVLMANGQNKGAMLRLFLQSMPTGQSVIGIIFADDGLRNIEAVEAAFREGPIDVRTVHYTRFQAEETAFMADEARLQATAEAWRALQGPVCASFGTFCPPADPPTPP